jgi:hypothetical protein
MPDGRLAYRLKTPWRDGTTHVSMKKHELLERLAPYSEAGASSFLRRVRIRSATTAYSRPAPVAAIVSCRGGAGRGGADEAR